MVHIFYRLLISQQNCTTGKQKNAEAEVGAACTFLPRPTRKKDGFRAAVVQAYGVAKRAAETKGKKWTFNAHPVDHVVQSTD